MKLIVILIVLYFILFFVFNFVNHVTVLRIKDIIKRNMEINSWLTTVFVVGLIGAVFTFENNQNFEKQVEITNRETAPLFHIEKRKSEDGTALEYYLKNDKGIASYITFYKYANFYFNEYEDEIKLTKTDDNVYYSTYPHNITTVLRSEEELESTIKNSIDDILQL